MRLEELLGALALGLCVWGLYLATLDLRANFDSLISAAWAESWLPRHGLEKLFTWNHFLFNATGWVFFRVLRPFQVSGYRTLQLINSAAAAAAVLMLFLFLRKRTGSAVWAAGWAALLTGGHVFWREAVSGEAYMLGTVWTLACVLRCCAYADAPTRRNILIAAACSGLAALYHTGNVVVCAVVLIALALHAKQAPWRAHLAWAMAVWAVLGAPYAAVYHLYSPASAGRWLVSSSYSSRAYEGSLKSSVWTFDLAGGIGSLRESLLHTQAGLPAALALIACLLLPWVGRLGPEERGELGARKRCLILFGSAFVLYFLFYSAWMRTSTYWCVHTPLLMGFLGLLGPRRRHAAERLVPLLGATALAGSMNLAYSALPNRDLANFPSVAFSRALGKSTPPFAYVLISGVWSDLKVHIPYFGRRKRLAMDLYLIEQPKAQALDKLAGRLAELRKAGVPVYILDELRSLENLECLKKTWGVLPEDIQRLLAPYREIPVKTLAAGSQRHEIILLWPKESAERSMLTRRLTDAGFPSPD